MKNYKFLVKIVLVILLILCPVSFAIPMVPSDQISEFTGNGHIHFFNTHSNEDMEIQYKDKKGNILEKGVKDIDYILRCRLTGAETDISLKLIALVDQVEDHFGGSRVEIISGYRSPELNSSLRSSGRGVAKQSLHMKGLAMDIRIPGIALRDLRNYAASLRAGGVGFYPGPNFVHVDVGRVRYW